MAAVLPDYIQASVPNPPAKRAPWYKNTAPAYAGIFLWIGFYIGLAGPSLGQAGVAVCLLGLLVAGLLCFGLYYYAPAMLGMRTGQPLYVVGASTFGTAGGYLMPGLLMGLLQIGWFAVATSVATSYILQGLHKDSRILYIVVALIWAYVLAWVAIKGIAYVAKVAQFLNWLPLLMVLVIFFANWGGVSSFAPPKSDPWSGFLTMLALVIGFFATAGAAGADFGMNSRNRGDVFWGGLIGIGLAVLVAGGLPLLSVAGHLGAAGQSTLPGLKPGAPDDPYAYTAAISSVKGLASIMFFLFAAASVAPTCFCTFIAANSFTTMLPKIPRSVSTTIGVTIGAILAVTGVATNLVPFFQIVGASFGPICGAMAADYILAGYKWSGPRRGINWAGYIAWAIGFVIGIPDKIPGAPAALIRIDRPSVLWSFVAGFVVYWVLAKASVWPELVAGTELSK